LKTPQTHQYANIETASSTPTLTVSQDEDFSTQAALSLTRASQTNNFVASKAYYDISFRTATAGAIKTIAMAFPTGTSVGSALVVEAAGIGPGIVSASAGEVLTYTLTNAVNVPANTIIRIQMSNINNQATPSNSLTVSITTRNAANGVIDGPTPTSAFNMVQLGNAQIAPGAVTTTKIATGAVTSGDVADNAIGANKISSSFMRAMELFDGQNGWEPDGVTTEFDIIDTSLTDNSLVFVNVQEGSTNEAICGVESVLAGNFFRVVCSQAPQTTNSILR
jgi:hypothetical protein